MQFSASATADALFGDASDISSDSDAEPPPKADDDDEAAADQDKVGVTNIQTISAGLCRTVISHIHGVGKTKVI